MIIKITEAQWDVLDWAYWPAKDYVCDVWRVDENGVELDGNDYPILSEADMPILTKTEIDLTNAHVRVVEDMLDRIESQLRYMLYKEPEWETEIRSQKAAFAHMERPGGLFNKLQQWIEERKGEES